MKNFRMQILRIYYSVTVGIGACLLTAPLTIFFGGILFHPDQGHAFFSPQELNLFLFGILLGLFVATVVGMKYYLYLGKAK